MTLKKKKTLKTIETLTHEKASRKNIPTAEYQSVMRKDEETPIQIAYKRRNRDLNPHRNYELRDPIEVRVLPSSIEIISYSGIDPSLTQSDFEKGVVRTRRYRNRQIGSFLKELGLTEGKGTGIPIIYQALKDNGSPKPIFDTDYPNRSFFVVEFPIYPDFRADENNGGAIGGAMELTARQSDNKISYRAIAKKLNINDSAVDKHIKTLKEKGALKRVGGTRGYWEVQE